MNRDEFEDKFRRAEGRADGWLQTLVALPVTVIVCAVIGLMAVVGAVVSLVWVLR